MVEGFRGGGDGGIKGFGVSSQSSALSLSTTIQSKLFSLITSLFSSRWWVLSGVGHVTMWVVGLVAWRWVVARSCLASWVMDSWRGFR